jgi:hypothetical protein
VGQVRAHERAEAAALPVVRHGDGHLGRLRVVREPYEAADCDQLGRRIGRVLGDQGHVIDPVDLGQVAELAAREAALRSEEAAVDALVGQAPEAV